MDVGCAPVECRDLVFAYRGGRKATGGVSLRVEAGQLLCLLGRNGAGKTTLIRQITGELKPSSGTVRVLGRDPRAWGGGVRRRMGVIPQHVALFESLTVEDHLRAFSALKGFSGGAVAAEAARVSDLLELGPLRARKARMLSGGEQRKVLLALALIGDPEVIILDEPTVGLDPEARRMIWSLLIQLRTAGKAMLLTTHHLEEAEHLASRVAFISEGMITFEGPARSVFAHVSSRLVLRDECSGEVQVVDSLAAAQAIVRDQGLERYAIGRETLDDVYMRMTRAPRSDKKADA
jgi:ABC-type multidrug transport system ATPase subunit